MKCPYCACEDSKVLDSRPSDDKIRRRRECIACGKRFKTYEIIERTPTVVVKKDGSREFFDRDKLYRGILRACEKRPVSVSDIEKMVNRIESELENKLSREIPTTIIGEMVMEELKKTDEVSYVRFASVYREFKDINTFMDELSKLLKDR